MVVKVRPDVLVGPPSNRRQKDETRRYDETEYEFVTLTQQDYREMAASGVNCVYVNLEQSAWAEGLNLFYWGAEGRLPFPEFLYRSLYLGPALFLDEPAVSTRDYVLRARLSKDEAFRKAITPQIAFDAFRERYREALEKGAPGGAQPRPGRAQGRGRRRHEISPAKPLHLGDHGQHLRLADVAGSARSRSRGLRASGTHRDRPHHSGDEYDLWHADTGGRSESPGGHPLRLPAWSRAGHRQSWGVSIYGSVQRADTNFWFTHAYDLGATRFHFWDNAQLACVPFGEVLALSKLLHDHSYNNPHRDLARLRSAAEAAILLPPGYDLGHVYMGKGQLWGIGELNLERTNRAGVKYRVVMSNFFLEIERCLRLGVAFDLLWDLPAVQPKGYREVVRVREDGKVEVMENGERTLLAGARTPQRPSGDPPRLAVTLAGEGTAGELDVTARARVEETTAPVYYTMGGDPTGIYHNAMVAFELYGPEEQDHRFLSPDRLRPRVKREGNFADVEMRFRISRPGSYRLRAATVDLAGRTTVVWKPLAAAKDSAGGKLQLQ